MPQHKDVLHTAAIQDTKTNLPRLLIKGCSRAHAFMFLSLTSGMFRGRLLPPLGLGSPRYKTDITYLPTSQRCCEVQFSEVFKRLDKFKVLLFGVAQPNQFPVREQGMLHLSPECQVTMEWVKECL